MLEIFEEIGMGRSLLILGAPSSGKTTMLLEQIYIQLKLISFGERNEIY
jgi:transcription termination factor Rho